MPFKSQGGSLLVLAVSVEDEIVMNCHQGCLQHNGEILLSSANIESAWMRWRLWSQMIGMQNVQGILGRQCSTTGKALLRSQGGLGGNPGSAHNTCATSDGWLKLLILTELSWDFPHGQAVKTLCSQSRGTGFDPWSGSYIPHAATKRSCMRQLRSYMLQLRLGAAKNKIKKKLICKMGVLSYNL